MTHAKFADLGKKLKKENNNDNHEYVITINLFGEDSFLFDSEGHSLDSHRARLKRIKNNLDNIENSLNEHRKELAKQESIVEAINEQIYMLEKFKKESLQKKIIDFSTFKKNLTEIQKLEKGLYIAEDDISRLKYEILRMEERFIEYKIFYEKYSAAVEEVEKEVYGCDGKGKILFFPSKVNSSKQE